MKLRVSAVQYHLHTIQNFEEFAAQVEHYVFRCGRTPVKVAAIYLEDEESRNYGALMEWKNPFRMIR